MADAEPAAEPGRLHRYLLQHGGIHPGDIGKARADGSNLPKGQRAKEIMYLIYLLPWRWYVLALPSKQ